MRVTGNTPVPGGAKIASLLVLVSLSWLMAGAEANDKADSDPVLAAWVARYDGPQEGGDTPAAVAVDLGGNVYVTGTSDALDLSTIKYDDKGRAQWVAHYDGPAGSSERASGLALDAKGEVWVAGSSDGGTTGSDYVVVRYTPTGIARWVSRYDGPDHGEDHAEAMVVDKGGNVYVTGASVGIDSGFDYATVKYDAKGVFQWAAHYDGPSNGLDMANSIAVDGEGDVYVTGISTGKTGLPDYATVKYSPQGIEQWVARYDGPGEGVDFAVDLKVTGDGNVIVTGGSEGGPDTGGDYATIQYDSQDGSERWVARYHRPDGLSDIGGALAVDPDGAVYVAGMSWTATTGWDIGIVKYDSSGTEQWTAKYADPGDDFPSAIALDLAGHVLVTGLCNFRQTGTGDFVTLKYEDGGGETWVARYDGQGKGYDEAIAIAVDAHGDVYVTGESEGEATTGGDFATIKYVTP